MPVAWKLQLTPDLPTMVGNQQSISVVNVYWADAPVSTVDHKPLHPKALVVVVVVVVVTMADPKGLTVRVEWGRFRITQNSTNLKKGNFHYKPKLAIHSLSIYFFFFCFFFFIPTLKSFITCYMFSNGFLLSPKTSFRRFKIICLSDSNKNTLLVFCLNNYVKNKTKQFVQAF